MLFQEFRPMLLLWLTGLLLPQHLLSQTVSIDSVAEWQLAAFNAQTEPEATNAFSKLLDGQQALHDSSGWRKTQMAMADYFAEAGWGSPAKLLQEAIDKAWWQEDKNTAYLYTYLGFYANQEGNRILAREAREHVYKLMKAGTIDWNQYLVSNVLRPLGNSYTSLGEHQKARLVLEDAFRYLENNGVEDDGEEMGMIASDLAILYQVLGENVEARKRYETTLDQQDLTEETRSLLLINLAGTLLSLQEWEEAQSRTQEVIALLRNSPVSGLRSRYLSAAYGTQAAIRVERKEPAAAQTEIRQAIRFGREAYPNQFSREMASLYLQQAEIHAQTGDLIAALNDCQLSLSRLLPGHDPGGITSVGNPNRYIPENRLWETFTLQGNLLFDRFERTGDATMLKASLRAHEAAMDVEALQLREFAYNESSLTLLAANRRQKSDAVAVAWEIWHREPSDAHFQQAISIAERSRSLLLQDRKNQLAIMSNRNVDPVLVKSIERIDSLIAVAQIDLRDMDPASMAYLRQEIRLDSLVSSGQQQREQLIRQSPLYASARFGDLPFSLNALQQMLPAKTLVVSYFLAAEDLFIFGISSNRQTLLRIPMPAGLNDQVDQLYQAITRPYMGSPLALGRSDSIRKVISLALYRELLEPVLNTGEFEEIHRLWLVPDGILGRIPFAVLHTEESSASYYAHEPFLIRKMSIGLSNNLTLLHLQLTGEVSPQEARMLCVAPSYGATGRGTARSVGTDIPVEVPEGVRLVFHLEEAQYLHERYGGGFLFQSRATPSAFLDEVEQYSILHFSGHAQPDSATGQWNFLALEPEPGSLDAFSAFWQPQILALRLNASMVYLSACETSRGKFYQGEGHSSLARAFLYAGSASVLATLWQIDDSVSLRFAQRFYEQLETGLSKDEALQQTMLSMIEENRPPYAWAPYLLWGDPAPVALEEESPIWPYGLAGGVIGGVVVMLIGFRQSRRRKRNVPA